MTVQITLDAKSLPTHMALVFFLPRVSEYMSAELRFPTKLARAIGTEVGELVGVDFTVDAERGQSLESFAAGVANVRAFAGVSATVVVPYRAFRERFGAQVARPVPPSLVHIP